MQKINEEAEWYKYIEIGKKKFKVLKKVPYRFGINFTKLMKNYIDEDTGTYDMSEIDMEEIMELVLCNMISEPKITKEYLYSDKCPIGLMGLGGELVKVALQSDDLKNATGIDFGIDEENKDENQDEEIIEENGE
jgi:hypothetical protein